MKTRAYAKINWTLFVTGVRKDGYHNLDTVMQRIDLYNDISISPSAEWQVSSADGSLPTDGTNLALKAAQAYQNAIGSGDRFSITIERNIPAGSGLGGGSADAAAVLTLLNETYGGLSFEKLQKLALTLGADVPYCLTFSPARCTGLGEIITPICDRATYHLLLAMPKTTLSTVEVFRCFDALEQQKTENLRNNIPSLDNLSNNMSRFTDIFQREDPLQLCRALSRFDMQNQLCPAACALAPQIKEVLGSIKEAGALFASMTGSGSCCFGLFETKEAAEKALPQVDGDFKAVVSTL